MRIRRRVQFCALLLALFLLVLPPAPALAAASVNITANSPWVEPVTVGTCETRIISYNVLVHSWYEDANQPMSLSAEGVASGWQVTFSTTGPLYDGGSATMSVRPPCYQSVPPTVGYWDITVRARVTTSTTSATDMTRVYLAAYSVSAAAPQGRARAAAASSVGINVNSSPAIQDTVSFSEYRFVDDWNNYCPDGNPYNVQGSFSPSTLPGTNRSTTFYYTAPAWGYYCVTFWGRLGHSNSAYPQSPWYYLTVYDKPAAGTGPATTVSSGSATLTGDINAHLSAGTAWFQYGTTTGYGASTPLINFTARYDTISIGQWISSLTPKTTYHFRIVAANEGGTTYGSDRTFTTLDISPPGAFGITSPANGASGVSLNPTLSWGMSLGADSYAYCYDTSGNDTCNAAWVDVGHTTSVKLHGLSKNTKYYWRVRATNAYGTTMSGSSWSNFTTTGLGLTKTAAPNTNVHAGDEVTYTIALSNSGTSAEAGVVLSDTLPSSVDFARTLQSPIGTSWNNDQLTWSGAVAAADTLTWTFVVTSTAGKDAVITNTVAYSQAASGNHDDAAAIFYGPLGCHARLNNSPTDYKTVQAAVDASTQATDLVKVAGYCAGVHGHAVPPGYPHNAALSTIFQTLYLDKTLTLQGGYSADFTVRNVETNPTTLDALGLGRALVITGNVTPTVDGLRLTNGDAAGLQGTFLGDFWDAGGGAYIKATAIISGTQVFSNTAFEGGGLFVQSSSFLLRASTVFSNTANAGGGLYAFDSRPQLGDNVFRDNRVTASGGGIYLLSGPAALGSNIIERNQAAAFGGGLVFLSGNLKFNNAIVDNVSGGSGTGLLIGGGSGSLTHNTIARNSGGGSALYVRNESGVNSLLLLKNTILIDQTMGIEVEAGSAVTLTRTLWGSGDWWTGDGTISHTGDYEGDPAFLDPDGGNYDLGPFSAAIDRGVYPSLTGDLLGRPRPHFAAPDLGAYEAQGSRVFLTIILGP